MNKILLLTICMFFSLLLPHQECGQTSVAAVPVAQPFCEHFEIFDNAAELSQKAEITATAMLDDLSENLIVPGTTTFTSHVRQLFPRHHFRLGGHSPPYRKRAKVMSQQLTTLIQHISHNYSSIRKVCWQRPADGYVFALRHIVI